jgi:hypothetical protein
MINAKLQNIIDTKSAIGNAIVNKGGTITGETPFFNYAAEINNISTGSVLTGNATTDVVFNGFTFYGNDANTQLTGTFVFDGNAAVADVSTGKTFYATNGTKLTGTGALASIDGVDDGAMFSLLTNPTPNINATIFTLKTNNGFLYAGLQSVPAGLRKYNTTTLAEVNSINQGSSVLAIGVNNGFVYASGAFNSGIIRKYHESNMVFDTNSATYGGTVRSMTINNGSVFIGGASNTTVQKFSESTLSRTATSIAFGGEIRTMTFNNGSIFIGGDFSIKSVRKLHESNLVVSVNSSQDYINLLEALAVNNGVVYAAGSGSSNVMRLHESNLTFIANLQTDLGSNPIKDLKVKDGFIYVSGASGVIKKYYESNLAFAGNSSHFGTQINNIAFDSNSIYLGGDAEIPQIGLRFIKKFSQNSSFATINGVSYYLVPK